MLLLIGIIGCHENEFLEKVVGYVGFMNLLGKLAKIVVEEAPNLIAKATAEGAKKQAGYAKKQQQQLKSYENQMNRAKQSGKMVDPAFKEKAQEQQQKLDAYKQKQLKRGTTYGGLTFDEWDRKWIRLGNLKNLTLDNLKPYNKYIGLYKGIVDGNVKYIGRAIEYNNGGFRKRLRDYVRPSDSGRKHQSGQTMNANASNIDIYILVMGNSADEVTTVKELELKMINFYGATSQIWNVHRS